jgi:hypothetical protein
VVPNGAASNHGIYPPSRPESNPDRREEENTEAAFLTKSTVWMHEREWRTVNYDPAPRDFPFPSDKLTVIILGFRMADAARGEVSRLAALGGLNVAVYQSRLRETEYKMQLEPIFAL